MVLIGASLTIPPKATAVGALPPGRDEQRDQHCDRHHEREADDDHRARETACLPGCPAPARHQRRNIATRSETVRAPMRAVARSSPAGPHRPSRELPSPADLRQAGAALPGSGSRLPLLPGRGRGGPRAVGRPWPIASPRACSLNPCAYFLMPLLCAPMSGKYWPPGGCSPDAVWRSIRSAANRHSRALSDTVGE